MDFTTKVQPKLEKLIAALELYTDRSTLPEKVDKKHWEWFVASTISKYITSKTFIIDLTELGEANAFAEKHGEGADKIIHIRVENHFIGTGFTVFTDDHEKDITNINNW